MYKVLSDNPLFFLINSYTTGLSPIILEHILDATVAKKAKGGKYTVEKSVYQHLEMVKFFHVVYLEDGSLNND